VLSFGISRYLLTDNAIQEALNSATLLMDNLAVYVWKKMSILRLVLNERIVSINPVKQVTGNSY
jgi:hypothetical protein